MRRLRGTPFDPFGRAAVRRLERELIGEYRTIVEEEVADLAPSTHGRAIRLAEAPDIVRGYEQIKVANVARFRDLVDNIRNPVPTAVELTTKSTMSDEAVIHDR
jgi:indolepyruvate ferredoxin oxidoreductase